MITLFGKTAEKLIQKTVFKQTGSTGAFAITFKDAEIANMVRMIAGGEEGKGKTVVIKVSKKTKSEKLMSLLQISGSNK